MMRKLLFLLLVIASFNSFAATGDTTWVQVYNEKWLDNYNNFDTSVQLPDGSKSYRKIYMIFTLGKYACPGYNPNTAGEGAGKSGWCGDWDYTVQNFIMMPNGDTLELGRLITPYANQLYPRTPLTWKERYVFDVTDYYPVLKNSAKYRIRYSGYSGGFTANVKFAFVEGTPERNVLGVTRLWHGDFAFGKSTDPIENNVAAVSKTAPANTQSAELKFNITGHGSDNTGCSEFCKKYYNVLVNGNSIAQKDIWRDNCGANSLYPQSGTWLYDRGNWCPGALVNTNNHILTGVNAGANYNVDVNFQSYSGSGSGMYTVDAAVVYYGAFNHQLDASLEDIIAPSDFEGHFRQNPICGRPTITVKNTGATTITAMTISYGIQGGGMASYSWTGSLAALGVTDITLPELPALNTVTGTGTFVAQISNVNNKADEDNSNNQLKSTFQGVPAWSNSLIINMVTNKFSTNNETTWAIYDMNDNVVAQCANTVSSTTYIDTVKLGPGCYKFELKDLGKNGLYWWANSGAGKGSLKISTTKSAAALPLAGYFSADFGSGFTQYFHADWPTQLENVNAYKTVAMDVYPNPAKDVVHVNIAGIDQVSGTIQVLDVAGRKVIEQACNNAATQVNVKSLPDGMYMIMFIDNNAQAATMQTRIIKG